VTDGVGVHAPAVAVGVDGVLLQGRAERQDAALFGLDVVDLEVEVELPNWIPAQFSWLPSLIGRPVTSA